MENTLAVLCVILGGVMILAPVLLLVLLLLAMPRVDVERVPRAVVLLFLLLVFIFRGGWYTLPASFTVSSMLLTYGVAALAHASRPATLSSVGIALLCSILLWGWYLVRILTDRRRGRPPS
jgi:hypothetical protein